MHVAKWSLKTCPRASRAIQMRPLCPAGWYIYQMGCTSSFLGYFFNQGGHKWRRGCSLPGWFQSLSVQSPAGGSRRSICPCTPFQAQADVELLSLFGSQVTQTNVLTTAARRVLLPSVFFKRWWEQVKTLLMSGMCSCVCLHLPGFVCHPRVCVWASCWCHRQILQEMAECGREKGTRIQG